MINLRGSNSPLPAAKFVGTASAANFPGHLLTPFAAEAAPTVVSKSFCDIHPPPGEGKQLFRGS